MSGKPEILRRAAFSIALPLLATFADGDAPVANADFYVVDVNGTLTVRASFPDAMSAMDPSLYWRFNDTVNNDAVTTDDRLSDAIASAAVYTSTAHSQSGSPTLRSSNSFKGFADTNTWFGFGTSGSSGAIDPLITPDSGWGSDLGAISFWFKTDSIGGDTTNAVTAYHSPHALFSGISDYSVDNYPVSFYRTAVVIGLVDGKIIFRVAENDIPIVEFKTTNTYNDSEWHHVVASWDNSNDASGFYVDGGSLGGATKSETMKSFDFNLATDFDFSNYGVRVGKGESAVNNYNGYMDELAIWEHKTLTAENARDLYFSGVGGLLSNDTDDDGDTLTANKTSDPSAGALTFESSGAFAFDASGVAAGNYTFTYKVNDGTSDSNDANVTIKVNGAPTGVDDSGYGVAANETLSVSAVAGVLTNDSDPNGDPIIAFLASSPSSGSLYLDANGSFTYDATGVADGNYTFTYKVSDGSLEAATANTVTIVVTDEDPPIISQGAGPLTVTMSQNRSPNPWIAPELNATDADTPDKSTLVWAVFSDPSNGNATVSGTTVEGIFSSPTVFTYVPDTDYNGNDSFAVQVSDGIHGSREADTPFALDAFAWRAVGGRRIQWTQTAVVSWGQYPGRPNPDLVEAA